MATKGEHLDLVICFDRSGSMSYGRKKAKLSESKQLFAELVESLLPEDKIAIVAFDSIANVVFPLTDVSELRNLEAFLGRISERGNTCLSEGVKMSVEAFDLKAASARCIIILSDGRARYLS